MRPTEGQTNGLPDASANASGNWSGDRPDQSADRLATVIEAAELLGITPDAVRSRLRRGTLQRSPKQGPNGEVLVVLKAEDIRRSSTDRETVEADRSTDQGTVGDGRPADRATDLETVALFEALQARIDDLSKQLAEANLANAEHRRLLAAALERIPPQIEASSETRESPVKASGEEDKGGSKTPPDTERRSWLHRFFFGPGEKA